MMQTIKVPLCQILHEIFDQLYSTHQLYSTLLPLRFTYIAVPRILLQWSNAKHTVCGQKCAFCLATTPHQSVDCTDFAWFAEFCLGAL